MAGGHTRGHPALTTIAVNAAFFGSLLQTVGTSSHGCTVTGHSQSKE